MKKKTYRKSKIFFSIIIALIVIRILMPEMIKVGMNNYFEDFSPTLKAELKDVDLAVLKGEIEFKDLSAKVKESEKTVLNVENTSINIFWSDLIKGELTSNVLIDSISLNITKDLLPALRKHAAQVPKEEKDPIKLTIRRLDVINSKIKSEFLPSITNESNTLISNLKFRVANITTATSNNFMPMSLSARVLDSGELKIEGETLLTSQGLAWTMDSELLHFDLTELNQFLEKNVPLTFTRGELDLYAEVKSEDGPMIGYIKPFIKNLDVIESEENFEGPKHWIIEVLTALGNITLDSEEVVATRIPFTYEETFKVDGGESIAKVLEHGFIQEQSRGIENSIGLRKTRRQAQED